MEKIEQCQTDSAGLKNGCPGAGKAGTVRPLQTDQVGALKAFQTHQQKPAIHCQQKYHPQY